MKTIIAIALFFGLAAAFSELQYQDAFVSWCKENNKMYSSVEFYARYDIFKSNMDYVEEWNSKNSTTVLGLTILADLSNAEYQRIYLGTHINAEVTEEAFDASVPQADSADWRTSGAVTGIKDQGQCGSCWSFSSTGSIEGAHKIKTGQLVSLSEQNLMDCSTSYGNEGCNGGLMNSAFKYVVANKGIDTEASYPYETKSGTCRFSTANIGATISSYKNVATSEAALATAVTGRPVSVAIDASKNSFQLYKSGIYYESTCSSSQLDHGVLAVGFGSDTTGEFWIVKNSWGTSWGTAGYILMARGKDNNCGIATSASYPIA